MKTDMKIISMIMGILLLLTIAGCIDDNDIDKKEASQEKGIVREEIKDKPVETIAVEAENGHIMTVQSNSNDAIVGPVNIEENVEERMIEMPDDADEKDQSDVIIMIHNNKGPMCLDQLDFLDRMKRKYPSIMLEEHYTYDEGTSNIMYGLKQKHAESIGVSRSYGYLPITFFNDKAYSGFNDAVEAGLEKDIKEIYG